MNTSTDRAPKRTAADVLAEIERKLATVDGIATADAFALGGLVREYGDAKAGDIASGIVGAMLDGMSRPKPSDLGKPPWL